MENPDAYQELLDRSTYEEIQTDIRHFEATLVIIGETHPEAYKYHQAMRMAVDAAWRLNYALTAAGELATTDPDSRPPQPLQPPPSESA